MLKDAPIVILDEATANVDPENEDRLQKAIEELTRNETIIMIAHRLKTVRNAGQESIHYSLISVPTRISTQSAHLSRLRYQT